MATKTRYPDYSAEKRNNFSEKKYFLIHTSALGIVNGTLTIFNSIIIL